MIRISQWKQYEVSSKGHPWEDGEPIRKKPLEYVRVAAHGSHWTPTYRDLLKAGAVALWGRGINVNRSHRVGF